MEPGGAGQSQSDGAAPRALGATLALLVAARLAYHLAYLGRDPFALVTFSDGQVYEEAARDILGHFPLGSLPLYLQGLYSYVLALGMRVAPQVASGLLLQLILAGLALAAFHSAARRAFGARAGALSSIALLAAGSLAFYENKYLSVSLGVGCNIALLWAFTRALDRPSLRSCLLVGAAAGLSVLGRPNMALGVPFAVAGLLLGSEPARLPRRFASAAFGLGLVLALAPLAARNLVVVGKPSVFPSHGGGIPLYIGNNPHANGLWNTAGGLLSGQVHAEQQELAARLGIRAQDPAELDARIGAELTARALAYATGDPLGWLGLEAKKLAFMLGNHEFVRDYDRLGEADLVGVRIDAVSLPFGCTLGLGVLGMGVVGSRRARGDAHDPNERRRARGDAHDANERRRARGDARDANERRRARGLLWLLGGQLLAIAAANLLVFTSAQNRAPLVAPLSFVAGPALLALERAWRARSPGSLPGGPALWIVAVLATAQAFIPRTETQREPSSVHHFNLGVVLEELGRPGDAAASYARATQRKPGQAVFALHYARALRRSGQRAAAARELERVRALGPLPPALALALQAERDALTGTALPVP